MKMKNFIKYVLMLIVSIAIGVGVALTAKGEQSPENGWAVALIASVFVFGMAEMLCKTFEDRSAKWKDIIFGVVSTMVFYFISYSFLLC